MTDHVLLTDSTYIATSGSGMTTAQLTAPSGKSVSDFQEGLISDDTNPIPAIDLASGKYTELEFMIEVDGVLVAISDEIEFRITNAGTELDSYIATPKIMAGGAIIPTPRNLAGVAYSDHIVWSWEAGV